MKTERTLKELLELMLANKPHFNTGLCFWCECLYTKNLINRHEHNILYHYIKSNPPYFRSLIAKIIDPTADYYYWRADNIAPRIKWLKKHIKKQSK
jgi:hypothetical protein